ncbi:MAG: ABC transporter substrate-binding protein [Candidatus Heimdallarchaeota archaeon]
MGFTIKSNKKSSLLIFLVITSTFMFVPASKTKSVDYFFTIKGIYYDQPNLHETMLKLKDQLLKIGINLELEVQTIFEYIAQIYYIHDYDLYLGMVGYQDYYESDVNSSIGYDITLDYNSSLGTGKNQWYLDTFNSMIPPNSIERRQLFYDWQDYLMDEIVPIYPLFTECYKTAYWDNLQGYNSINGVIQSIGNMQFDFPHTGQQNTSELILAENYGFGLNPIINLLEYMSNYALRPITDPLVWVDGDKSYWPHIAKNWVHINDTHVRFTIREDIKWDVDIDGLYPSELLDTEDIYFSYYCYKNIYPDSWIYQNIKQFEIVNETTIDFYFDGDPDTSENEIYLDYLDRMSELLIVPEHYLNQTQLGDGITPDITHPSWSNYTVNCFGTGPFKLESYVELDHRNLTLFEDSWRMDPDLLLDPSLNWEQRFGSTWAIKKMCIVEINGYQDHINSLLAGGLDLLEDIPYYYFEQIPTGTNFKFENSLYGPIFQNVGFNLREVREFVGSREPCINDENITKGLAVRKAIAYGFSAEEINQEVYNGEVVRNFHPISKDRGIWCSPTITRYTNNLGEASKYMKLLGYNVEDLNATSEIIGIPFFVTFIGMQFIFVIFLYYKQKKK